MDFSKRKLNKFKHDRIQNILQQANSCFVELTFLPNSYEDKNKTLFLNLTKEALVELIYKTRETVSKFVVKTIGDDDIFMVVKEAEGFTMVTLNNQYKDVITDVAQALSEIEAGTVKPMYKPKEYCSKEDFDQYIYEEECTITHAEYCMEF